MVEGSHHFLELNGEVENVPEVFRRTLIGCTRSIPPLPQLLRIVWPGQPDTVPLDAAAAQTMRH